MSEVVNQLKGRIYHFPIGNSQNSTLARSFPFKVYTASLKPKAQGRICLPGESTFSQVWSHTNNAQSHSASKTWGAEQLQLPFNTLFNDTGVKVTHFRFSHTSEVVSWEMPVSPDFMILCLGHFPLLTS